MITDEERTEPSLAEIVKPRELTDAEIKGLREGVEKLKPVKILSPIAGAVAIRRSLTTPEERAKRRAGNKVKRAARKVGQRKNKHGRRHG